METLHATKHLQNNELYKEYISLRDYYYRLSLHKEEKQQDFFSKKSFVNLTSGEVINPSYSFEKYYKKYSKSIEQKVYCIEQLAKDYDLVPVFMTLTLDSRFHPFQSVNRNGKRLYVSLNDSFIFENIETSIKAGYERLNHIYRVFYKRCKEVVEKLLYVKVFEMHNTLIPHLHILFLVKKTDTKIIRKKFQKIKEEFNLDQVDFELLDDELKSTETSSIRTGVKRASKYIMKYISKSIRSDAFGCRLVDGWKRENKIRMITSSNLALSLSDFRNIYYNIDEETKDSLLEKAKSKDVNIFYYILKNFYKLKVIKKDGKTFIKEKGNIKRATIRLFITQTQIGTSNLDDLNFSINNKFFRKDKYYKLGRL